MFPTKILPVGVDGPVAHTSSRWQLPSWRGFSLSDSWRRGGRSARGSASPSSPPTTSIHRSTRWCASQPSSRGCVARYAAGSIAARAPCGFDSKPTQTAGFATRSRRPPAPARSCSRRSAPTNVWGAQTQSALETGRFAARSNLRTPHGQNGRKRPRIGQIKAPVPLSHRRFRAMPADPAKRKAPHVQGFLGMVPTQHKPNRAARISGEAASLPRCRRQR
jgi:hypothetical protein